MTEGRIDPGSAFGNKLGFTSDLFEGWLWLSDSRIMVSSIESKKPRQGNFSRLCENILGRGFAIDVPTPMGQMPAILKAKGFRPHYEWCETFGEDIEVWSKELV